MKELMKAAYIAARSEFDMIPERREAAFEEWYAKQDLSSLQSKGKTSAEEFLRDKYKLVDFHDLTLNGKPWVELMEEYAQSHANKDGWTDEKVSKLLKMQIEECAVFAQRCGRDKGMASIEYDQWIKETPILDLTPQTNNNEDD